MDELSEDDHFVAELRAETARVICEVKAGRDATFTVDGVPIVTLRPRVDDDGTVPVTTESYLGALAAAAFCGARRFRGHVDPLAK